MKYQKSSEIIVQWGDCDPADIVFYPNYFRWFDVAAHNFLDSLMGSKLIENYGIVGFPLVEVSAKFILPSTYRDAINIETAVGKISERRFVLHHRGIRDGNLLFEGRELRVAARHHPEQPGRLQSIQLGEALRQALQAAAD